MRASLRILVVGLAVVVGLSTGTGWSQERGPANMLDLTKDLDLHVDKVLEGSEEIKPGEDMGEPTPRGIYGMLVVANNTPYIIFVSRGSKCNNPIGYVTPYSIIPLFVGDWAGSTKLCAYGIKKGDKAKVKQKEWRQTVTGKHATYRWNLGPISPAQEGGKTSQPKKLRK
ncbi:MAG TPA: hypothetical protein VN328_00420 [Thermodesulfovibrionales bacterium]|nr:hypothetical protein [Thermodesulfovibrionales bacterium]